MRVIWSKETEFEPEYIQISRVYWRTKITEIWRYNKSSIMKAVRVYKNREALRSAIWRTKKNSPFLLCHLSSTHRTNKASTSPFNTHFLSLKYRFRYLGFSLSRTINVWIDGFGLSLRLKLREWSRTDLMVIDSFGYIANYSGRERWGQSGYQWVARM